MKPLHLFVLCFVSIAIGYSLSRITRARDDDALALYAIEVQRVTSLREHKAQVDMCSITLGWEHEPCRSVALGWTYTPRVSNTGNARRCDMPENGCGR